jgi:hypothetical protein
MHKEPLGCSHFLVNRTFNREILLRDPKKFHKYRYIWAKGSKCIKFFGKGIPELRFYLNVFFIPANIIFTLIIVQQG